MSKPSLPSHCRLPINRCNLPAVILGSLTFQRHPVVLQLDGVQILYAQLFDNLNEIKEAHKRAQNFQDYMRSCFLLDNPEEAGFDLQEGRKGRSKADYLRMLRGWLFDPNGKEAAVLKSWVESRFGLLPRNHHGPLGDFTSDRFQVYLTASSQGLYNTNALEAQIDLLYSYCQYEIQRQFPQLTHLNLYRGVNRIDEHEILSQADKHSYTLVLNNLNSFTSQRERADEFGDYILKARVPLAKVVYFPGLLADIMRGEDEYLVIGGVYDVVIDKQLI